MNGKLIEYFSVEIKPWVYPDTNLRKLEVRTNVNGKTYFYTQVLYPDDMESRFDQYFALAKQELKKGILKEAEGE